MVDIITIIFALLGLVLGVMWLFLPWIILSKLDQIVHELKKLNQR